MDIDIEDGDLYPFGYKIIKLQTLKKNLNYFISLTSVIFSRSEVDEGFKQNKRDGDSIKKLKKELDALLRKAIAPRGIFTRYPTQTGKLCVETISSSGSAIAAVGKQIPWSSYEEKVPKGDLKLNDKKKMKKNKKKYWKPKSNK